MAVSGLLAVGACTSDEPELVTSPPSAVTTAAGATAAVGAPAVEIRKLPRTAGTAEFDLEYPALTYQNRPGVAEAVNAAVRATIDKAVADFEQNASDGGNPLPTVAGQPNTFSSRAETVRINPSVASFRIIFSTYMSGAAHPGSSVVTQTFDLDTGKPIALADLFPPGVAYLDTLSGICATRVDKTVKGLLNDGEALDDASLLLIRDGTAAKAENYAAWALGPDGLEVTFQEYQVGPYAIGPVQCDIPRTELAGVTRPGGQL